MANSHPEGAGEGCINCKQRNDGGYMTDEVGPFCSECWASLELHFSTPTSDVLDKQLDQGDAEGASR